MQNDKKSLSEKVEDMKQSLDLWTDDMADRLFHQSWLGQKWTSVQMGLGTGLATGALVYAHEVLALGVAAVGAGLSGKIFGKSGMIDQRKDMQNASATFNMLAFVSVSIGSSIYMMEQFDYHERRDAANEQAAFTIVEPPQEDDTLQFAYVID